MAMKMIRTFCLVTAICFLTSYPQLVHSETLEIPLNGLSGGYWENNQQVLSFEASGVFIELSAVSLRLVGECGNQSYIFSEGSPQYCCDLPSDITISLHGEHETPALTTIQHHFPDGPQIPINLEWIFELTEPEDLAAIADGSGEVILEDLAVSFWSWEVDSWIAPVSSPCDLESATLILEFGSLVGTEPSAWGAIKAVYR